MRWIKERNSREIAAFIGGGLAVAVGAAWTAYKYLAEKEQSGVSVEATYQVCVGDSSRLCPKGSVWLSCGNSIAAWASRECASYDMASVARVRGGDCGYRVAKVVCRSSRSER